MQTVSHLDDFSMHSCNTLAVFLGLGSVCLKKTLELRDTLGEMLFQFDFHLLIHRRPVASLFAHEQDVQSFTTIKKLSHEETQNKILVLTSF